MIFPYHSSPSSNPPRYSTISDKFKADKEKNKFNITAPSLKGFRLRRDKRVFDHGNPAKLERVEIFHTLLDISTSLTLSFLHIRIIQSPLVTFVVGETKTPIQIHAAVVQDLSDPLAELIVQQASHEQPIILEGVEAETFTRFTEFAYRGTYVTPMVHDAEMTITAHDEDGDVFTIQRGYPVGGTTSPVARTISPVRNTSASHRRFFEQFRSLNFYDVPAMVSVNPNIMFHAKLYVFATEFQILSLQRQCLSKLHRDLCEFYMNPSDVGIVLDLVDYVYTHTERHELEEESSLRNLVFRYAMCHVDKFVVDERFEQVLRNNVALSIDILREVLKGL